MNPIFKFFMQKLARLNQALIIFVPFAISLSSFVMGYFIVYFTMLEEYIQDYHNYSDQQLAVYFTLTYALLPVGAFLAAFFYDHILETYGENKLLRYLDYLAIAAIVMQMVSIYTPVLCLSRLLMGIFCGFTTGIVPSYIVSIAPSFASGIIGSYSQMSIVLGMAFAYYMGQFLDNTTFSDQTALRFFIGLPIVCLIVHLVTLHLFPFDNIERLIYKRDNATVRRYLKFVYGKNWKSFESEIREHKILPVEVAEAPKDDDEEQEQMEPRCKKFNEVILGIILAVASQATGINAILEYAKQLFMVIEDGDETESDISVLMLGFFQVGMTLVGGFLINRYGRRRMMLIGHGIVVAALFCGFFIAFFIDEHESITVLVIFLHVLGFSISLGPILMLYSVEALTSIRLVIIVYWGLVTVVTLVSDVLIERMEIEYIFLLFGVCSVFCYVLLYLRMIETKDVPRKKIRELIEGTKTEWQKSTDVFRKSTAFPQAKSETLENV